jgi:hypothetical protein
MMIISTAAHMYTRLLGVPDSGSEKSIISERIYDQLSEAGVPIRLQNAVLVTTFGNSTTRIRKQAYIVFKIGDCIFEHLFMISPQLVGSMILGNGFAREIGHVIHFHVKCFSSEK